MKHATLLTLVALSALSLHATAQAPAVARKPKANPAPFWVPEGENPNPTPPTLSNVPYGKHEKQVMDFWKAESAQPTPLVFFIHGGSWKSNDKNKVTGVKEYLAAGISVVSINYRFTQEATAAGVKPPVKWPLEDAARALQFVRSKSAEWNLDKTRIGASGGSAGACSSLWLAFHDDMADPKSDDPSPANPRASPAPESSARRPRSTRSRCASGRPTAPMAATLSASPTSSNSTMAAKKSCRGSKNTPPTNSPRPTTRPSSSTTPCSRKSAKRRKTPRTLQTSASSSKKGSSKCQSRATSCIPARRMWRIPIRSSSSSQN